MDDALVILENFICENFQPATGLHDADLTLTTPQFIVLIGTNFGELEIYNIAHLLKTKGFKQQYFDGEMVWLIAQK